MEESSSCNRSMSSTTEFPQDICDIQRLSPNWFNVLRRLRSCATKTGKPTVITARILVDPNGHPITWETWHNVLEGGPSALGDFLKLFGK